MSIDLESSLVKQALGASGVSIASVEPLRISVGLNMSEFQRTLKAKEAEKEALQQLANIALTLKNVDTVGIKDLISILASPKEYVASKHLTEKPILGGILVPLENVFNVIPEPYQLASLEKVITNSPYKRNATIALNKIFQVKANVVSIKKEYISYLEDQYTRKHEGARAEDYIKLLCLEYQLNDYLSSKNIKPHTFFRSNLLKPKGEKLEFNREVLVNPSRIGVSF